jgi:RNA polymerase sigma factor (sigma-70 family)
VDQTQVAELYRRHVPVMVSFATLLLGGDRDRAQDLVHDAFVKAATRLTTMRNSEHFDAYLRRCVANAVASWGRHELVERRWLRRQRRSDGRLDPALSQVEDTDSIVTLLGGLPSRQRLAVTARVCLDLSEIETADLLGCSVGTVKSLTSRGLTALRAAYGVDPRVMGERK